jgi:hypothetical protein
MGESLNVLIICSVPRFYVQHRRIIGPVKRNLYRSILAARVNSSIHRRAVQRLGGDATDFERICPTQSKIGLASLRCNGYSFARRDRTQQLFVSAFKLGDVPRHHE